MRGGGIREWYRDGGVEGVGVEQGGVRGWGGKEWVMMGGSIYTLYRFLF